MAAVVFIFMEDYLKVPLAVLKLMEQKMVIFMHFCGCTSEIFD